MWRTKIDVVEQIGVENKRESFGEKKCNRIVSKPLSCEVIGHAKKGRPTGGILLDGSVSAGGEKKGRKDDSVLLDALAGP